MVTHKPSRSAPRPFGNYLLYEEIARGGMARVFRAGLRGLAGFEKKLVVKQILPDLARDPRFVELFVREANTVVSLSHPHIVPVYDLGRVDGVYFLSMEYVEGETLAELLRAGPLSPPLVAHIGVQIADALAYAHGRAGLVHRDVTPRNIMIDAGGHARLLDFGVAAPAEGVQGGEVFGSPGYMSPEQARGEGVDGRSDVFALGASLFRALSGREAFGREDSEATHEALMASRRPQLSEDLPGPLAALVEQTMALAAPDRPAAETLVRGLRTWLAGAHPEGVSAELGAQVEALTEQRGALTEDALAQEDAPAGGGSEVQTLATRPAFAAMLQEEGGSTKPVSRRPPEALDDAEDSDDAEDDEPGTRPLAPRPSVARADGISTESSAPAHSASGRIALGVLALAVLALAGYALSGRSSTTSTPPLVADAGAAVEPARAPDAAAVAALPDAAVSDASHADAAVAQDAGRDASRAPAMATLTVTASPWASVKVDGRLLGNTPLRARRVSAGWHTLSFDNPPLGRSLRERVRIAPGEVLWFNVDLSQDPPRVQRR